MDKKILLGGAAALLLGAGLFAAPASAAIEISHSGEAKLTATFSDTCAARGAGLADNDGVALAKFIGNTAYTADDTNTADEVEAIFDALYSGTAVLDADADSDGDILATDYTCVGNAESPVWTTSSKLDWSAAGTLANGLSVSTDQDAAVTLSGAFGSLEFKSGGDSAVKGAFAGFDGDVSVAGSGFGGHALGTAGTAGMVVNYAAPSMGGMDLMISYAPNSNGSSLDNANYTDTIAFGAKFAVDAITISAGWESATHNNGYTVADAIADNECDWTADLNIDSSEDILATDLANTIYGTDECGDQTLMVIGASMSVADLSIAAGFSELDTEEADRTTTSASVSTTLADWNLGLEYVTATRSSLKDGADVTQTAMGVSLGTALGDGVDLTIKASTNEYDDESQTTARGGKGATNDFKASAELKLTY